jgi:hypothetical protein
MRHTGVLRYAIRNSTIVAITAPFVSSSISPWSAYSFAFAGGVYTGVGGPGPHPLLLSTALATGGPLGFASAATTVPEPASIITWSLLGVGMIGGGWFQRRRKQQFVAAH